LVVAHDGSAALALASVSIEPSPTHVALAWRRVKHL